MGKFNWNFEMPEIGGWVMTEDHISLYRGECPKCGGVLNNQRLRRTCLQCGARYFNKPLFRYPFEVVGFILFLAFVIMAILSDFWDLIVEIADLF
jgi:hypothetical protein